MFLGIIVQVLRCSYVFTVTYLLLLFFLIYLFVTAKATQQVVLKRLPGLGSETSNRLYEVVMSNYPAERNASVIFIENTKLL